jgi:hypothetical protein
MRAHGCALSVVTHRDKREGILGILLIAPSRRIKMQNKIICLGALIKGSTTICNRRLPEFAFG